MKKSNKGMCVCYLKPVTLQNLINPIPERPHNSDAPELCQFNQNLGEHQSVTNRLTLLQEVEKQRVKSICSENLI
jgi:hypothetical protein